MVTYYIYNINLLFTINEYSTETKRKGYGVERIRQEVGMKGEKMKCNF